MRKILFISLILVVVIGLTTTAILYAHYPTYYGDEDVKVYVKKIDKGIQIIITSDDPEVVKDIQENSRYYEDIVAYSDYCPHREHRAYHRCGYWW